MPAVTLKNPSAVSATPLDHQRGPVTGITLIEYGDYENPSTRESAAVVARLEKHWAGRIRYIYRHFPQDSIHPHAWLAAEASEAAAAQGKFWEMHAILLNHSHALAEDDLKGYAESLRLDMHRFVLDLSGSRHAGKVFGHYQSGCDAQVSDAPAFFINGRMYPGNSSFVTLSAAIEQAWFGHRSAPAVTAPARKTYRASPALIREIQLIAG